VSEWWTYRSENFLLFSERAYWRMFALANEAYWPLPLMMYALGIAGVFAIARQLVREPGMFGNTVKQSAVRTLRMACAALSIGVAWVAWSFLYERYAPINWAIQFFVAAFALQAIALLGFAFASRIEVREGALRRGIALALLVFAVAIYPLLAWFAGRGFSASEVIFIAPDPTAVAMIAVLLLNRGETRFAEFMRRMLFVVPFIWLAASTATLATLGSNQAIAPAVAVAAVLGVGMIARFRRM
jgi:hypothetical protein